MIVFYVILGIVLLLSATLLMKVKVFICYDENLKVYAKILFFKFKIAPAKIKIPKKKKRKKKGEPTTPPTLSSQKKVQEEKSIVAKLWEIRSVLVEILPQFLGKLHFKFLKLRINIACDNAAKTALLYAGANQGVTYIIEILRNISNVDVTSRSDVCVNSDFLSQKSELESKIELYIRFLPLITVGLHAIKEYTKFKSTKEV